MIEVEKNFDLRPGDKERLIQDSEFLARRSFTDVYYDTADFSLTCKDFWLRARNGRFELKVPLNRDPIDNRKTDQYREFETDEEIAAILNLVIKTNLAAALADAGHKPFATIITARTSYRKGDFHLDFDEMDFGYVTFEAELMVRDPSDIPSAEARILEFAKAHGIRGTEGHGKLIEYLLRNDPKHYEALIARGVVRHHQT